MILPQGVKIGAYDRNGKQIGYFKDGDFFGNNGLKTGYLDDHGKYISLIKGEEETEVGYLVSSSELRVRGMKVFLQAEN